MEILCPNCKHPVALTLELANSKVYCPTCTQKIAIPSRNDLIDFFGLDLPKDPAADQFNSPQTVAVKPDSTQALLEQALAIPPMAPKTAQAASSNAKGWSTPQYPRQAPQEAPVHHQPEPTPEPEPAAYHPAPVSSPTPVTPALRTAPALSRQTSPSSAVLSASRPATGTLTAPASRPSLSGKAPARTKQGAPLPAKKSRTGLVVTLGILLAASVAGYYFFFQNSPATTSSSKVTPTPTAPTQPKSDFPLPSLDGLAPSKAPDFSLSDWSAKYGQPLANFNDYKKNRPYGYGGYFSTSDDKAAEETYTYLGPLGVRARAHDDAYASFPNFRKLMPKALTDSGGLLLNALEILDVFPGSPADGLLEKGDLIVGFDGKKLLSSAAYRLDQDILCKDKRSLERHAGDLLDAAEGKGVTRLAVIKARDAASITLPSRDWKTIANKSMMDKAGRADGMPVNLDVQGGETVRIEITDGGNQKHFDGVSLNAITLSNGKTSIPLAKLALKTEFNGYGNITKDAENNVWKCHAPCVFDIVIPEDKKGWKLTGSVQPGDMATIEGFVKTLPPVNYPDSLVSKIRNVDVPLPKVGSFGPAFDPDSPKVKNLTDIIAARLLSRQNDNGSFPQTGGYTSDEWATSMCGLALLSTGDPKYNAAIKKAARFVAFNGGICDWAIPAGHHIMFLAEYYLRTKDDSIIPALNTHINRAKKFLTPDYTAGHKTHPGYDEHGYIGGGGAIAAGLAIALHTPATVDRDLFNNMMNTAQDIAPDGHIPYGRNPGRKESGVPDRDGQGFSLGTGPYVIASCVGGGPKFVNEMFVKRYTSAPYGNVDNGHASNHLSFIWGMMGTAATGNKKAMIDHLSAYVWKLTFQRGYDGVIMPYMTNRLEYQGAEGIPDFDQRNAMWLLCLNAPKQNMAMTGAQAYRAKPKDYYDLPLTTTPERLWLTRVKRNYEMVVAALANLYSAPVPEATTALAKINALSPSRQTYREISNFLASEGVTAMRSILNASSIPTLERSQMAEMMVGVDHTISVQTSKDAPNATLAILSRSPIQANGNAMSDEFRKTSPLGHLSPTGKITLTDPSGKYLDAPKVITITAGKEQKVELKAKPGDQDDVLEAHFQFNVAGIRFDYSRTIRLANNLSPYINNQFVRVPGTMACDFENWTFQFKPKGSQNIVSAARGEGGKYIVTCKDGNLSYILPQERTTLLENTPGIFTVHPANNAEARIVAVEKLDPNFGIVNIAPNQIRATSGSIEGDVSLAWDFDPKSGFSLKPNPQTGLASLEIDNPSGKKIYSIEHRANNARNVTVEALVNDQWIMVGIGRDGVLIRTIPTIATKFRINYNSLNPTAKVDIKEIRLQHR